MSGDLRYNRIEKAVFCCLLSAAAQEGMKEESYEETKKKQRIGYDFYYCLSGFIRLWRRYTEAALGSAEEYVQAAKTALAGQDSFTANFDATIAMNNAGRGSMTTKGTVTFVKEPLYMKVDTDMGFDNGSQRYILYLQKGEAEKNEDGVNQYMNYDGQWTEMTLQKTDAMNSVQIYNTAENMETLLAAAENCTMQENGGKAVISADIPAEKLYDVEAAGRFFRLQA